MLCRGGGRSRSVTICRLCSTGGGGSLAGTGSGIGPSPSSAIRDMYYKQDQRHESVLMTNGTLDGKVLPFNH